MKNLFLYCFTNYYVVCNNGNISFGTRAGLEANAEDAVIENMLTEDILPMYIAVSVRRF